jgi:hypothetical protein
MPEGSPRFDPPLGTRSERGRLQVLRQRVGVDIAYRLEG